MKLKAPTSVSAPTGAVNHHSRSRETRKLIIGFLAVELKEIHSDLPQLPDRMQTRGATAKVRSAIQCRQCSKTFTEPRDNTLDGMYLPMEKAEMVLALLLEGNSVSSVERITEVHHRTILKLLVLAGEKCERIMAEKILNVRVRDVECDEVWSFIGKKAKARPSRRRSEPWRLLHVRGHRTAYQTGAQHRDGQARPAHHGCVHRRLAPRHRAQRFQITTDGFAPYKSAILNTCTTAATSRKLIKVYRAAQRRRSAGTVPPKSARWRWSQSWAIPIPTASALR